MPAVANPELLRAALRYAKRGWRVLPLHSPQANGCSCDRSDCPAPGKHPRTRHGVHEATTSLKTIRAWWHTWPDANLGLATGTLVVIDIDGTHGEHTLARLEREHEPLPNTVEATTGRGRHLYFASPERPLGNSAGRLGHGLDVRGHGGHVVAPPSRHAGGHHYRWARSQPPAALPTWITAELAAPARRVEAADEPPRAVGHRQRYVDAALRCELADITAARLGTRNNTLNRAAFRLAQLVGDNQAGLDRLQSLLLDAALTAGLADSEARATITSGITAGRLHPRRKRGGIA